ncbi:MAG TPA: methyl-accepting chemotaxis protein [Spirochaetales bacterium]|nr:methyl-accepting chemotaxis protein [Spirochaetales bacterium]HOV37848.1 methyl-accepting chemotaxis protein [Spirochaetales bacterium]
MRKTLVAKILIAFCILNACIVALLSLGIYFRVLKEMNRELIENSSHIIQARAEQISVLIEKLEWQLKTLLHHEAFDNSDRTIIENIISKTGTMLSPEVVGLFYTWPDGSTCNSLRSKYTSTSLDHYKKIREGEDFVVGKSEISPSWGIPVLSMAQAHRGNTGTLRGMIGLQIKLSTLSAITEKIKLKKTGYGWLIDRDGLIIAHPDESLVMEIQLKDADTKGFKGLSQLSSRMLNGEPGFGEYRDTWGNSMSCFFTPVPGNSGLTLAISIQTDELTSTISGIKQYALLISIIALLLTILVSFIIANSITSPLKKTVIAFKSLTKGEADLSIHIPIQGKDEVSDLVINFNTFIDTLRNIVMGLKETQGNLTKIGINLETSSTTTAKAIQNIRDTMIKIENKSAAQMDNTEQASSAVTEIAKTIESLDTVIQQQVESITEASSAVEQMVRNITSVTSSIVKMSENFTNINTTSHKGIEAQNITAEKITEIEKKSKNLVEANEVIAHISSQTNLLAMNAAIEAAHAGGAGKGFSVVAEEIRKLAETSAKQSKTIGANLKDIVHLIDDIVHSSKNTESTYQQLNTHISQTSTLVQEIQQAMEEQREGSQQILKALKIMNEITSLVSQGASEMAEGDKIILEEVQKLQQHSVDINENISRTRSQIEQIEKDSQKVLEASNITVETIYRMDQHIGKFKV